MARRFGLNSTDLITLAAGGLANSNRAGTVLVVARRATVFNTNMSILSGRASDAVVWDLLVSASAPFGNGDFGSGGPTLSLDDYTVFGWTKTSGTAVYRYHVAGIDGDWTHQDGTFAVTDGSGGTDSIEIGTAVSAVRNVDIAAGARWLDALSDTEIEACGTTDMADWLAGDPDGAWQFNQDATSTEVVDLTGGGADQTAIVGTSVTDDPAGWTYATVEAPEPAVGARPRLVAATLVGRYSQGTPTRYAQSTPAGRFL